MRIEFLFAEVANLFGSNGDMEYIQKIFPEAEILRTQILETPRFIEGDVELVYFGPMSEQAQVLAIQKLMPYVERIRQRIEDGQAFLAIGNAVEIFGQYIETSDETVQALNIFPFYAKQQMLKRINAIFLGEKDGLRIVGSKSQFTQVFKTGAFPTFCPAIKGMGLNQESKEEGVHYKNFIGTYLLGPFLIMNPLFTERWFGDLFPGESLHMPYHALAIQAYEKRIEELLDPRAVP